MGSSLARAVYQECACPLAPPSITIVRMAAKGQRMHRWRRCGIVVGIVVGASAPAAGVSAQTPREAALAAFAHLHRVATHPRCTNCHSTSDRPLNGDRTTGSRPHDMNIARGIQTLGTPCATCHQEHNLPGRHMPPGAPHWTMPDADKAITRATSPRELCATWKDAGKNRFEGGDRKGQPRTDPDLLVHVATDPLVRWAWTPGDGRERAPGTHAQFVQRFGVWIKGGAPCP
jgi:hypothetical protein